MLREASGGTPAVTLIATGSEVTLALECATALEAAGTPTRVVSLPCWEVFGDQDPAYRASVLGEGVPRVSLEMGTTLGWERWIGDRGLAIGIDRFGGSAPGGELLEAYGFSAAQVVERVQRHLAAQ